MEHHTGHAPSDLPSNQAVLSNSTLGYEHTGWGWRIGLWRRAGPPQSNHIPEASS